MGRDHSGHRRRWSPPPVEPPLLPSARKPPRTSVFEPRRPWSCRSRRRSSPVRIDGGGPGRAPPETWHAGARGTTAPPRPSPGPGCKDLRRIAHLPRLRGPSRPIYPRYHGPPFGSAQQRGVAAPAVKAGRRRRRDGLGRLQARCGPHLRRRDDRHGRGRHWRGHRRGLEYRRFDDGRFGIGQRHVERRHRDGDGLERLHWDRHVGGARVRRPGAGRTVHGLPEGPVLRGHRGLHRQRPVRVPDRVRPVSGRSGPTGRRHLPRVLRRRRMESPARSDPRVRLHKLRSMVLPGTVSRRPAPSPVLPSHC